MENYKISIWLFTLFPNLITKESHNWWITRRFWGFRQQISKTKYLKIPQNIGGKYQEVSGEHSSTVQNGCSPIRVGGYQMIRIRPSGEVETPTSPIQLLNSGREHLGGKWAVAGCKWRRLGVKMAARFWVQSGGSRVQFLPGYVVWMPSDGVSGRLVRVYSLHGFQRILLNLRLLWWSKSYQNTKT